MNIALLVPSIQGGGMERVAAQMSTFFSNAGHMVYIVVGIFDKRKAYTHAGKVVVEPLKFGRIDQPLNEEIPIILHNIYYVTRVKREYRIDITISFAPEMNIVNMCSGIRDKKVLTIHNCLSERRELKGLCYNHMIYKIYNHAYKVVTVSKWCKEDMIYNYDIKRNKIKVIYNPVEANKPPESFSKRENIVLIVGRLQDIKQQWHIIRAFKKVLEEVKNAKLIIAGSGENKKYLEQLCIHSGISDRVFFEGFVREINKLYQQAKCVVFSSASESFSCAAVEAMANGVPVVTADCPGGIREVITGNGRCDYKISRITITKGGIITPRLDGIKRWADRPVTKAESDLADAIIYLLKNETKRLEIANRCLQISELFSMDIVKNEWLKLLEEAGR